MLLNSTSGLGSRRGNPAKPGHRVGSGSFCVGSPSSSSWADGGEARGLVTASWILVDLSPRELGISQASGPAHTKQSRMMPSQV